MLIDLWQSRATLHQVQQASGRLEALYAPPPFHVPVDKSGDNPISGGDNLKPGQLPKVVLTPTSLERAPLFGPAWRWVRRTLHQLVIFYVAQRQGEQEAAIQRQEEEIARLKAELTRLTRNSSV
jgi:hypothetical protein